MPNYKLLSVNEDNGHSDRLSAVFFSYGGFNKSCDLKISVDAYRKMTIKKDNSTVDAAKFTEALEFHDIDLDGLIQYLQDVKVFLSEEDIMKALLGQKR